MKKKLLICIILTVTSLYALDKQPDAPQLRSSATDPPALKLISQAKNERRYTMTASIRPILFWISIDGVGGGHISLIDKRGEKRIQLLIGSDPERAPRRINRWGYISEHTSDSSTELIGVMTRSDEESIEQADNAVPAGDTYPFKAIRSRSSESKVQSSTYLMNLSENFTYKNVDAVLGLVPKTGSSIRQMNIPQGVDPGFLHSVKEMIHASIEQYRLSGHVDRKLLKKRQYVYNASLFELSLKSSKLLEKAKVNGRNYGKLIESWFEARNTVTGKTAKFMVSYETDGPLPEIPVRIVYQPRWWFKAELSLIENKSESAAPETVQQGKQPDTGKSQIFS